MILNPEALEQNFEQGDYGLSARRLYEHTELGQINVFARAISSRSEVNDAESFIDVVMFESDEFALAGFTLAELRVGKTAVEGDSLADFELSGCVGARYTLTFVAMVAEHLATCAKRQATRNQRASFLPIFSGNAVLGLPHIFSSLQRRLQALGNANAGSGQWLRTIENFQKKGLRAEELERSGLRLQFGALDESGDQACASDLADWCDFGELRLSVIPVVQDAQRQLRFGTEPDQPLKRTKKLPKAQAGQARRVVGFDKVLGYRVEQIEHQTLWGAERHWQAVTFDGTVILSTAEQSLFTAAETAEGLASSHAKLHFPKRSALGRWRHWAWTGGQDYTEWLVTLPHYPSSFFSSHFSLRNVLAHLRCDVREGSEGELVLLLHEVQSDWAQTARRSISVGDLEADDPACPPFLKEWPALVMKLVLLHAASGGLDAVAWTRGEHQVFRYKGLGATGLVELYDRTLPREVNRMLKPFGAACEDLGVFVPTNFGIKQSEYGYEVYTADNELLATALTLEDALQFVPADAHELLYDVHGVRLSHAMRKKILNAGFPAWG